MADHYNAECRYDECHVLFMIMLKLVMLNVNMLSAIFVQRCHAECH